MSSTVISIDSLVKRFRAQRMETTALAGISLSIARGEFVAVMGPSGCGKSTLLNILGLLDRPDSGSLRLLEVETRHLPERRLTQLRREHIGFVFQNFNLIEELTVRENIELALKYQRTPAAASRERAGEVMSRLGIEARADHYAVQLSGGQQQRAAIARAIVSRPAVLLADEPTGNLDELNRGEVLDILSELNREGSTIVMVTHSAEDAARASRIVRLEAGRIVDIPSEAAA